MAVDRQADRLGNSPDRTAIARLSGVGDMPAGNAAAGGGAGCDVREPSRDRKARTSTTAITSSSPTLSRNARLRAGLSATSAASVRNIGRV